MEFPDSKRGAKAVKNENLEVTGVSRSGRVRKKSSKLLDFESPDEVDNRNRKKSVIETTPRLEKPRLKSPKTPKSKAEDEVDEQDMFGQYAANQATPPDEDSSEEAHDEDYEVDTDENVEEEEDANDDDDFEGNLVVDEKLPTKSIYMMEKNKRKMVMRDGQMVAAQKSFRKDKGKSRFTAYMMWAKEVRQALNKQFPDMDFSTMARRLSEMWATVPKAEREHWKRKAKREALKKSRTKPEAPLMPSRKFINKKGSPISPLHNNPVVMSQKTPVSHNPVQNKVVRKQQEAFPAPHPAATPQYRVTGIAPIDVAAHLKLLGESLSVIGERLQEHEGQIAVSGSLSVLLDSLLCSMGALTCLTQQVDELKTSTNPNTLSQILNNTAYIMPGLG